MTIVSRGYERLSGSGVFRPLRSLGVGPGADRLFVGYDRLGLWRAMIASRSALPGRVPKARPPSPPRREPQNASVTADGAGRASNPPCRASATRSATRRAWGGWAAEWVG